MKYYKSEIILDDNYPVYIDYFYIADGKFIQSDICGTVKNLKLDTGAEEIRKCDIVERSKAK